jgi:hypothetical protein
MVFVPHALGQISPVIQERSLATNALAFNVGGGSVEDSDSDSAPDFGPFFRTITSVALGAGGANASANAVHESQIGATSITGLLGAHCIAVTGGNTAPAQADAETTLLFIFNLTESSPIQFQARGELDLVGRNENGEPSDLFGWARVRLINAITEEPIAALNLMDDHAGEGTEFSGTLPAGQYAILASAKAFVFSPDLLGPPPRSGTGDAQVTFSLTVVPAPATSALLALAGLVGVRRRRN